MEIRHSSVVLSYRREISPLYIAKQFTDYKPRKIYS